MGIGDRLRRLDERTGAHDYARSRVEFFAPFWIIGFAILAVLAVVRRDVALGVFAAAGIVGYSPFIYVGMRHRRDRNRGPDKWRDPW